MTDEIYRYEPLWGNWKVKELLGKGSLGRVYKISKTILDKEYFSAVKFITVSSDQYNLFDLNVGEASDKQLFNDIIKDIIKEVDLLYKLKGHGNIITYEDHMVKVDKEKNACHIFIKMEYAKSLDSYIKTNPISESEIVKIGIDICEALITCHANSILHRDIKEANIFRTDLANYKLGDFSVSRGLMNSYAETRVGTLYYIAPEIFLGKQYNHTIDIYSLGISMYRLLNKGRLPFMPEHPNPFTAADVENAQNKRLAGEKFNRPLTGEDKLVNIVLKACSYEPKDRYQSAAEMRRDLLMIANEDSTSCKPYSQHIKNEPSVILNCEAGRPPTETKIKSSIHKKYEFKNVKKIVVCLLMTALSIAGTIIFLRYVKFENNPSSLKIVSNQTNSHLPVESPSNLKPSLSEPDKVAIEKDKNTVEPVVKEAVSYKPEEVRRTPIPSLSPSLSPSPSISKPGSRSNAPGTDGIKPPVDKNLVLNSGAESLNDSWKSLYSADSKGSAIFTKKEKHTGKSCLEVEKTNIDGHHHFYQEIKIEKNKKYKLSVFTKTENLADLPSSGAFLKVSYIKTGKEHIYFADVKLKKSSTWKYVECSFTVPSDLLQSTICIHLGIEKTTGIAYFDDIKLVAE